MEPKHLGCEFKLEGAKYLLIGSASTTEVVVKNIKIGEFFMLNIDPVTAAVLGTKQVENYGQNFYPQVSLGSLFVNKILRISDR